jgi:hypothetical protein
MRTRADGLVRRWTFRHWFRGGRVSDAFPAGAVSVSNMYAVTKDGQRFLVNRPSAAVATPLTVIVSWTSTLQK